MSDDGDDELEAAVKRLGTPVSERYRNMALGAFAWRDIDAELASLVEEAPLVRSAGTTARLYRLGSVEIEIEVSSEATDTRRVVAVVDGADPTAAALHDTDGGAVNAPVVSGVATWRGVSARLVRVEIRPTGGDVIMTEWFTI